VQKSLPKVKVSTKDWLTANAAKYRLVLVVKHYIEERTMYLQSAITSSANVSCDILPTIGSGWPSFP
jgi:hypothetical protein